MIFHSLDTPITTLKMGSTMESNLQISELFNVDGLVAVITGGGTGTHSLPFATTSNESAGSTSAPANSYTFSHSLGIGKMMATSLAENGAHKVYIVGRREEPLKELVAKYPGYA